MRLLVSRLEELYCVTQALIEDALRYLEVEVVADIDVECDAGGNSGDGKQHWWEEAHFSNEYGLEEVEKKYSEIKIKKNG